MVLILKDEDIMHIISMKEAIQSVEEAFRDYSSGVVQMPQRQIISIPEQSGWIANMSAYLEKMNAVGTKLITVYTENKKRRKPTTIATIILNNYSTGEIISIMEAGYLTSLRTGAVGAVASNYLSRNNSSTIGIFGAGIQARTQLEALHEVHNIKKVFVYDLIWKMALNYSIQMSKKLGIEIIPVELAEKAVTQSDIIVTASTSKTPVFDGELIKDGTHINAIGSHTSLTRELDTLTVKKAKVIVDQIEAALKEYGEIKIPIKEGKIKPDHIYGDLGEIVTHKKNGRLNEEEITLFKSGGLAIQDIALAQLAFNKAIKLNTGRQMNLFK